MGNCGNSGISNETKNCSYRYWFSMTSRVWLAPFLATLVRPNLRSKRESGYHLKPLKTNYEEAWCARGDSNSRPSGFHRRRTLSSFALAHPLRQDTFQFLAALSRLQILFPSHRFCARRIFLLMRQCPQSSVFRGFCDAAIVLS